LRSRWTLRLGARSQLKLLGRTSLEAIGGRRIQRHTFGQHNPHVLYMGVAQAPRVLVEGGVDGHPVPRRRSCPALACLHRKLDVKGDALTVLRPLWKPGIRVVADV